MYICKISEVNNNPSIPENGVFCVYSLHSGDDVIYVGQSSKLKNRILNHLSSEKEFTHFTWRECQEDEANNLEAETIVNSSATLNRNLPGNTLYKTVGGLHRGVTEVVKDYSDGMDILFRGAKSNYISVSDYNLVIDEVRRLFERLRVHQIE